MATLRDIQRRIKAVKSTKQITQAMKMVAAAKLRRAQTRMMDLRAYADKMNTVIANLSVGADRESHPLLAVRPRRNVEVLVYTSDRGLCGAFNSNVLKASVSLMEEIRGEGVENVSLSIIGKKARDYFRRRDVPRVNEWLGFSGKAGYADAQEVAAAISKRYVDEEVDEVHLIFNKFKNVVQQVVTATKLLPVEDMSEGGVEHTDFIYEPSEDALLEILLPKNVETQIFMAALESQASEEAARMTAMENATKSCNEMIDSLTLSYNKARQASITADLMDIVGGVEALKD
jgi:F-type H+-transporting ATPase subunit gamma